MRDAQRVIWGYTGGDPGVHPDMRGGVRGVRRAARAWGGGGRARRAWLGARGGPVRSGFCRQPRAAAAAPCSDSGLSTPRASGDVEVGVRRRRGTVPASAPLARAPPPRRRAGANPPLPPLFFPPAPGQPPPLPAVLPAVAAPGPPVGAGPRGRSGGRRRRSWSVWGGGGGGERGGGRRKSLAGGGCGSPRSARRRYRAARGGGGERSWPPARLPAPGPGRCCLRGARAAPPLPGEGRRGNEQSFSRCG